MTTIQDGHNTISFLGPEEIKNFSAGDLANEIEKENAGDVDSEEEKESLAYKS